MTQPSALAAITAALTAKQTPAAPAAPAVQQAFTFTPQPNPGAFQPAPFGNPGAAAPVQTPSAPNPFQPTPVQAQAAFVAAVPFAGQLHAHPQTGVPFAPINPPGEATSAPTVGLDAAPAVLTQTVVAPEPAPKAARTRKPRAGATNAGGMPGLVATESAAGDGAGEPAAAFAVGSPSDATPTLQDLADFDQALHNTATEVLRDELVRRGWTVSLA